MPNLDPILVVALLLALLSIGELLIALPLVILSLSAVFQSAHSAAGASMATSQITVMLPSQKITEQMKYGKINPCRNQTTSIWHCN